MEHKKLGIKVLGTAIFTPAQAHKCVLSGCQCVTVTDDVLEAVITHSMVDAAINGFVKYWTNVYREKTIFYF